MPNGLTKCSTMYSEVVEQNEVNSEAHCRRTQRNCSRSLFLRHGYGLATLQWDRGPQYRPTENPHGPIRVARATKRRGARWLAAQSSGDFSGIRVVACPRPPVHSADPAPRRGILLAPAPDPGRQARPRPRGVERRAGRLGLANIVGGTARGSRAAGALSRKGPCQEARLLLCVRPAGVPVRMASRSVARRGFQPECELARLLRLGLEAVDGAERPRLAFATSTEPPLRFDRRAARQGRGGRSPRAAVPGLARRARRASLAGSAGLLGRAQSAGHQPIRPRGEMRAGIGVTRAVAAG